VQLRHLRERDAAGVNLDQIVGCHPLMQRTFGQVRHFCARTMGGSAPTVLLLGETGTGKGLIAKAIHYNSARRSEAFVEVNCAAIPSSLIESELFGYERGAFTDAKSARPGLFETAHGGTLFLDEIGSLPMAVQAKLLTAIEEKRIRRIGARQSVTMDVQIIAASHPVLGKAVRRGEFREDLYHRLNVVAIELPPLRERGDDKLQLARSFLVEFCRKYGMPAREFNAEACAWVSGYRWPGNVRELRNQIERIVLLSDDLTISPAHFDSRTSVLPPSGAPESERGGSSGTFSFRLPPGGIPLERLEREAIVQALERSEGNVSSAARLLSVSRQTLMYRMKKHGVRLSAREPRATSSVAIASSRTR
jgi:two-component system, NtrC family, response regulator AtoC